MPLSFSTYNYTHNTLSITAYKNSIKEKIINREWTEENRSEIGFKNMNQKQAFNDLWNILSKF